MLDPCRHFPGVMERFDRVSQLKADGIRWFRCPVHNDHMPSGWAFIHASSKMLVLKCFKGCGMLCIMRAVGLTRKDIHMETKSELEWIKHAHYDYQNLDGSIAFRVVRIHGMDGDERVAKRFVQQKPLGEGKWKDDIEGITRPLYRLPEMIAGLNVRMDRPVFFVEGEGKCDLVRSIGLLATTMNGGANAQIEPHQAATLAGWRLALCQDNDEYGRKWAERLLFSLAIQERRPRSITIMAFDELERHGDIADLITKRQNDSVADEDVKWELLQRFRQAKNIRL